MQSVGIIGGGLAGLTLAIQLAQKGIETTLFEKKEYPFHRVCGEYIAIESWDFLERLGLSIQALELPIIKKLKVSAPNGAFLEQPMKTGGFGISRYTLDNLLAELAIKSGVKIIHESVENVDFQEKENFFILKTSTQTYSYKLVCGAFGKRSNLDIFLNRDFARATKNASKQFIGVKYHLQLDFPDDVIELHNFSGGYCGISKIEGDKYCLCYLSESQNLTKNNNSIAEMEKNILFQNPFLQKYFSEAQFLYEKPLTISQISFASKPMIENHILMLGDSAGMITPLCGNGMTMAMQASHLLHKYILSFLNGSINRNAMEQAYQKDWHNTFGLRMKIGRFLQNNLFGGTTTSNMAIGTLKYLPFVVQSLIKLTHGKPY
ncbi:MAG: FAD-dependent monooxygenase [Raineya sp.]|jgi:flavin-dependent dehydrogenase|nr:FAD-dependent monooxygenase [Raineya sp.]